MKRRIRSRHAKETQTLKCLRFSFSALPPNTQCFVKQLGNSNDSLDEHADSIDYVIHFRPPLSSEAASNVLVQIVYCGNKHQTSQGQKGAFAQHVLPKDVKGVEYTLMKDLLEYVLFETHQLQIHKQNGAEKTNFAIGSLFVTFENNLVTSYRETDVCIEAKLDMGLHYLPSIVPGTFLRWFPPNIDPAEYGIKIDPTLIPQRTPLWFKLCGISGTKAYTLLGFWVPKLGSKEADAYNFHKAGDLSNFAHGAARLGCLSENYILMTYCHQYPKRMFAEMGWCPAPLNTHYPIGYGASPDGLFIDKEMTWSLLPPDILAQYSLEERKNFDITHGACEFKTSRTKTAMEAYFIPQVYMEMIALRAVWADLVRFRREREFDETSQTWKYKDVAYIYRIYRDLSLEKEMLSLWKYAYDRADQLCRVVTEPAFVAMRHRLACMATDAEPVAIVHVQNEPALKVAFDLYAQYQTHLLSCSQKQKQVADKDEEDELLWQDINERHQKMLRLDNSKKEMAQMICMQMNDYSTLLNHSL